MRKLSLAVLVGICLTLGACSNASTGGSATTSVTPTSTPVTTQTSGKTGAATSSLSPQATKLTQELANLQILLGETNSDLAQAQQDH